MEGGKPPHARGVVELVRMLDVWPSEQHPKLPLKGSYVDGLRVPES